MEKLTKVILKELNEWDLSSAGERTLKIELAKALTKVVKKCNLDDSIKPEQDCGTPYYEL